VKLIKNKDGHGLIDSSSDPGQEYTSDADQEYMSADQEYIQTWLDRLG